jgi:hypothetical protein
MRRNILPIACAFSLLLGIISAVLWVIDLRAPKSPFLFLLDRYQWQTPHWFAFSFQRSTYTAGFDGRGLFFSREDLVTEAQIEFALAKYNADIPKSAAEWSYVRTQVAVEPDDYPIGTDHRLVSTSSGLLHLLPTQSGWPSALLSDRGKN